MIPSEKARLIDANFNRAKEAIRVLEDICRFYLLNKNFSHQLRNFRHTIDKLIDNHEEYIQIINTRETNIDPGRTFFVRQLQSSIHDVALSNIQRLQEALRSLEEIYKTISIVKSNRCMKIRFSVYDFAKIFLSCLVKDKIPDILLYIIGDIKKWFNKNIYRKILQKKLFFVQFREETSSDNYTYRYLKIFTDYAHSKGVKVIVNNRCDLCLSVSTDGIHIGENDLPIEQSRQIVGYNKYIGYTTHSIEKILKMKDNVNIDYISFGTIFKSKTKKNRPFYGENILRDLQSLKLDKQPILVGGINADNIEIILKNGFSKVAVSNAIFSSDNPLKEIDKFFNIMYKYK